MILAIVGPAGSGKDETSKILSIQTSLRYTESVSHFAAQKIYNTLKDDYSTLEECYRDRVNHRKIWGSLILRMNGESKCEIYKSMLKSQDIINGVRKRDELIALRGLGDVRVVWVDRDVPRDPSLEFGPEVADDIVDNHGSLGGLTAEVLSMSERLGIV